MESIYSVLSKFDFDGELISCKEFGSGHINKTYIAKYRCGDGEQRYVVQKVNGAVFKNIDELMENVFAVTSYLRKVIKENGGDPDRETLHYIKTKDGEKYYKGDDTSYYRAYIFVKNSISYDSADTPELFGASGTAFGKFQKMLGGFDSGKLYVTIPNFHNTIWRYENEFLPALKLDVKDRAGGCRDEIDFITSRKDEMGRIEELVKEKKIPLRVTHNDTKLNNVMFDKDTNECVCVIDLDTVMPGVALFDFADAIRFGASTAAEDEKELDKVSLNLDYFEAYTKGFLSEAGSTLNNCEKENLAFASILITLELGMRFLTDYLNGDEYFKTDYAEHNLVRARNQLALVKDMESKLDEMNKIVLNCSLLES
ncbi:MAG: aminoglycoside phosphotransferase family protein [Ruminococcaceae bacterium]|nr:aminoglycoside phosphotransferase family protein [Oscillospiraceae bacterium]